MKPTSFNSFEWKPPLKQVNVYMLSEIGLKILTTWYVAGSQIWVTWVFMSFHFDVWSREKKLHLHHLPLLKTHLLTRHCLSAVIHHGGFELLMEAASVSRPLSMIHSLSPSVRCPLLLPSLPPHRCSPRPSSSSLMDARRPPCSWGPQSEQQIAQVWLSLIPNKHAINPPHLLKVIQRRKVWLGMV